MIVRVSRHRDGWKKFIGGKRFYSSAGMDKETFLLVAGALEVRWTAIKAQGGKWTEEDIDAAYATAGVLRRSQAHLGSASVTASPASPSIPEAGARTIGGLYIHAAAERYLAQLKLLVPTQISIDHYEKNEQHVRRIKKLMPDAPVAHVGYDDLVRLTNAVVNGKKANGEPFAVETVVTIMTCIKGFLNYLADSNEWNPPRGFERAMKVDRSKIAARDERDEEAEELELDDSQTFNVDELAYLWKIATNPMGKVVFGLGLFAGFTANDIATLRKSMVVVEEGDVYIHRKRQKTRHKQRWKTKWWVPPEVAVLVQRAILSTSDDPSINPKGLVFLTRNDHPLVHRSEVGKKAKTDNVALIWGATIRKGVMYKKTRKLSQKHLRKTGGRLIRYGVGEWSGAGLEVAQQFLAHAVKTVAEKNYIGRPDFSALHDAQRGLYRQLRPLVIEPVQSKAQQPGSQVA